MTTPSHSPEAPVDITVIFATANRATLLAQTLGHFEALDTRGLTWQLIVVDNGSKDTTPDVLATAGQRLPLIALSQPEPGKNRALNLGLPHAAGELIVFTDDDVVPGRDWLQILAAASRRWPTHDVFAGRITPRFPDATPAWMRQHPFSGAAYARFELSQEEGPTDKLALGPNFAVRRCVIERHQFSEAIGPNTGQRNYAMGSETEYLHRVQRAGHTTIYVPAARVEHVIQSNQTTPEWLLGRSFRLGRGLTRLGFVNSVKGPRLFGTPVQLLPTVGRTWLRYRLSPLLGWHRHFDVALEYQFLRGSLHELRLLAQEQGAQ
jgi:glycosyltransferase involved in cell wall biosynthesis